MKVVSAAGLLLQQVIAETRAAACSALELEVFAENTPAVRLYRSHGVPADGIAPAADAIGAGRRAWIPAFAGMTCMH